MVKKSFILVLAVMMVGMFAVAASAQSRAGGIHLHVAQMGMGGMTSTISTNAHTLYYNPALLADQKFALEITPVQMGVGSELTEIINFISDHQEDFNGLDSLAANDPAGMDAFLKDSESFDNRWNGILFNPYFGFAFKHFAFGTYGKVNADVKLDQGIFVPAAGLRGYFDVTVGAGWGRHLTVMDEEYSVGITGRYIQRREISAIRVGATEVAETGDLITTLNDELNDSENAFAIDLGAAKSYELSEGSGGAGRRWVDVGVVLQDIMMSEFDANAPNFKIGGMYNMTFASKALIKHASAGLEFVDFFNGGGTSLFSRINMGAEVNTLGGFLKLRGGAHQGYPTYGVGISLLFIKVDYAFFTREMGTFPGAEPDETHRVQLSLGW
ncbi:hypothetical protein K8I28_11985 [bacterium]|nr:hypothetical protein [bacterium]